MFDCNPNYWCFIPIAWEDVLFDDLCHFREGSDDTEPHATETNEIDDDDDDDPQLQNYIERVPVPPSIPNYYCHIITGQYVNF